MLSIETTNSKNEPFANNHRIEVLDGLRGLAIILVVGYHYFSFMRLGWVGVDLFFVLSGFLITGKLINSKGGYHYFSDFYLKRFLRILPLYYLTLIVFFLVVPFLFPELVTSSYQTLIKNQAFYWTLTVNWFTALKGWPANTIFVPFWSLSCEMQYYLIWPFLVFVLLRKKEWLFLSLSLIVLLAIGFRIYACHFIKDPAVFNYVMLPSRIDSFAIGALLYFLFKYDYIRWLSKWALGIMFTCILIVVFCILYSHRLWALGGYYETRFGYTLNAVFWAVFMAAILHKDGWGQHIFKSKLLVTAGKYSYGIYLLHIPVKVLLYKWLAVRLGIPPGNSQGLLLIMVTLVLAILSYQIFEKRFLSLKFKINRK